MDQPNPRRLWRWPRSGVPALVGTGLGGFVFMAAGLSFAVAGIGSVFAAPPALVVAFAALGAAGLLGSFGVLTVGVGMSAFPFVTRVDGRGVRLGRLGLRRLPAGAIAGVRLRAHPGSPIRVSVEPRGWVVAEDADLEAQGHMEFDLAPIRRDAADIARVLGVPLEADVAPDAAWRAHRERAVTERRAELAAYRARSLAEFGALHDVPAYEPDCVWDNAELRVEMPCADDPFGGRAWGRVRIDRTHVQSVGVTAELLSIEQVYVHYRHVQGVVVGVVHLEVDGRLWEVVRAPIHGSRAETLEVTGHLKWIAETLIRLAQAARPVQDEPAPEIPDALRRMALAARRGQGA